jgi:hypothetical protein
VRLTVGDQVHSQRFEIVNDPRIATPLADLQAQLALLQRIYGKLSDCHKGVNLLRDVRAQAKAWAERLEKKEGGAEVAAAANALVKKLDEIEDVLILPGEQADTFGLNERVRLNARLSALIPIVASADRAPTRQAGELFSVYAAQADEQLANLQALLDSDLEALNTAIQDANLPAVLIGG